MNTLLVDVSKIRKNTDEKINFKQEESFEPVESRTNRIEFASPVKFDLVIESADEDVLVKGHLKVELKLICGRCAKPFVSKLELETKEIFYRSSHIRDEDESEEFMVEDEKIDVGRLAEQSLILSLPMKIVCSDDCKGLCANCGINLNEGDCGCKTEHLDPRLSKLKDLLNQ